MSKRKVKKKLTRVASLASAAAVVSADSEKLEPPPETPRPVVAGETYTAAGLWFAAIGLGLATIWAYWPTIVWMEDKWRHEPDYSHGYLVFPLALLLLFFRRSSFPAHGMRVAWGGISLLILAIGLRILGRLAYMDFLDAWSLIPWVAGLVWLLFGRAVLWWAAPAMLFLVFLSPMPYRAESLLSFRLQGLATTLSASALQTMGFAAIPEGNTIWLDDNQLMVEEACSGLRIFVGMIALGFFFAALSSRSWIDRVVIFLCCFPIAILVNVLRVTFTSLAIHWLPPALAHQAHDLLGILMIVAGAVLMQAAKTFWENLYRPLSIEMIQRRLAVN